jgi:hypothetical protein
VGGEELVDQIALGAHDLDAVVAGLGRQQGALDERLDLLLDPAARERPGAERVDRRLDLRGRDAERVVGVAPGMEDLKRDLAAVLVDGIGDHAMLVGGALGGEPGGEGEQPALAVGSEAAGDHQADATGRSLAEVGGEAPEVLGPVLEAGVHRAHHDPVAQGGEAEVERLEKTGIWRFRHRGQDDTYTTVT